MGQSRKLVALGEVAAFVRASTSPERIPIDAHYILLEHVTGRTGQVSGVRAGEVEIKSAKFAFARGDVLYGKLRPQLRKCCVATEMGYCSTDIVPLRPFEDNTAFYLAAVLRSDGFAAQVERLIGGANLPRVNVKELLELTVRWPSMDERVRLDGLARMAIEVRAEAVQLLCEVDALEAAVTRR